MLGKNRKENSICYIRSEKGKEEYEKKWNDKK